MESLPSGSCTRRVLLFLMILLIPCALRAAADARPLPELACPSCDDQNPCTVDSCDTATGTCRHDPLHCDDGNPCTIDFCAIQSPTVGGCRTGTPPPGTVCDDGNSCTTGDVCVVSGSFVECTGQIQPVGTTCDDGNSCTTSDTCSESGQCLGTALQAGSLCDDQSLCTSNDTCVTLPDASVACQGSPKDCGDSDLCTQDLCDPGTGQCVHPPVNCDDGNVCTADSCDPATGECLRANQPGPCSSVDQCVTGLSCSGGNCVGGTPVNCSDNISCTFDACEWNTGCTHTPQNSLCGSNGPCAYWLCLPEQGGCTNQVQQGPAECDGNPCTTDACIGGDCRIVSANTNPCNDGNPCTIDDRCSMTTCRGTPVNCDDGNVCTTDSCNPGSGACQHANNTGPCSDGDPCTADVCSDGVCQSGPPMSCDDGDPCTVDSCTASGCVHASACDDGNPCTTDLCDPATLACQHVDNMGPCSDGNACTVGDVCGDGVCQGGTPMNCDDGNDCTNDQCVQGTCAHYYTNLPCDDHNSCTINDTCNAGRCSGSPRSCNDFNICTDDSCDPLLGCVYTHNTSLCSDGNACTVGDVCGNGDCQGGTPLTCDDGDVCTIDSCDALAGCAHQPNTGQTTCGAGACQRTVETCLNGVPQACVPGTPAAEVCNGVDDDCDGFVDEGCVVIRADCVPEPATLNLSSQGNMVSVTCRLFDFSDPADPVPIPAPAVSQIYVSRLDSADTAADDVRLPDPSTLPCPDPILGMLYERGIVENQAIREFSENYVTFKFNQASDGQCSTLDGDRQDIAARLTAVPDNSNATFCVSGKANGKDFDSCMLMLVRNKGLR